jgi:hypothetical protein
METTLEINAAESPCEGVATSTTTGRAAVQPRAQPWPTRLRNALHRWWQHLWMDEMTAYFAEATSHVDLEYRIRTWNRAQRRGRVPFI